jgi:thymidine phosphorylase
VVESIETLKGRGPADLETLSVEFAARMLVLGGLEAQRDAATERARRALRSGAALERFRLMIEAQGGDAAVVDDYARLPAAPGRRRIRSPRAGFIAALDAELVGRASMTLGGGRDTVDAAIDHGVGVVLLARPGDLVVAGQPVFEVHVRSEARLDEALTLLRTAVVIDEEPVSLPPLVREVVERPAVPLGGVT